MTLHHKSLTPTLHGVNAHFIHHPSKSRIIQSETVQPKKNALPTCTFLHFCANFWALIQNTGRARLIRSST